MAAETSQTESETTQQPLYRVRARHVLLSSDPPEESEPLPVPRYDKPSPRTQLNNGGFSLPGLHAFTSSLPESMSLMKEGAASAFNGPPKLVELAEDKEDHRGRENRAGTGKSAVPLRCQR
jgi:hypothetical protein